MVGLDQIIENNEVLVGDYPCIVKGVNNLLLICETTKANPKKNNYNQQVEVRVKGK